MAKLYHLLEDKLSEDIFWARLQFDCDANFENEARLLALSPMDLSEEVQFHLQFKSVCERLRAEEKQLFLYGAGPIGKTLGQWILEAGGDFFAYCARNHEKYVDGVNGKRVYPPEYVFENADKCFVLIPNIVTGAEIFQILAAHHFPREQIRFWIRPELSMALNAQQYFSFPELFPKGTAFVDAGCYDCGTSKNFAQWCCGDYSKIFAFEPDPESYQRCLMNADQSGLRLELFPLGLSNRTDTLRFSASGTGGSHIVQTPDAEQTSGFTGIIGKVSKEEVGIQVTTLDRIVGDTKVGFIKMDIEGAELDALHGAAKTILRDKPMLAVCVYHKCGDVLAIMDYLHELVPQYRFWLRQYGAYGAETILYAAL